MIYNIDNIKNEFIFFWGHQVSKDGEITKACLSQWWLSSFNVSGKEYKTAEHWMMAKKAELFNDNEIAMKILACDSPVEVKKLGRMVKNYCESLWIENRFRIVKEGNFHKFNQNELLKQFLLGTNNTVLVEASPVDNIWGIGMSIDDKDCVNPKLWKGLNLLGFALMEVRDELRESYNEKVGV